MIDVLDKQLQIGFSIKEPIERLVDNRFRSAFNWIILDNSGAMSGTAPKYCRRKGSPTTFEGAGTRLVTKILKFCF